jgi:ribonuclease HI
MPAGRLRRKDRAVREPSSSMKRERSTPPPRSAQLFGANTPYSPAGVYIAHVDGASRGNPGPASYAVTIEGPGGERVFELGKYLGRETNNVAEYHALIAALDYATAHKISRLRVLSDSELLVRQMQGRYKVKSADLRPLYERAVAMSRTLDYFAVEHIPREKNREADKLANEALDRTGRSSSDGAAAAKNVAAKPVRVRAHYVKGVLVPLEPLELEEGAEVLLDVRMPPR